MISWTFNEDLTYVNFRFFALWDMLLLLLYILLENLVNNSGKSTLLLSAES